MAEPATEDQPVTRTVVCKLETSNRKNCRLRPAIEEWQEIAKTVADHHPSFPEDEWGRTKQNPSFYRIITREHPDRSVTSAVAGEAVHKVGDAFQSWRENRKRGERPMFGDGRYVRVRADGIQVEQNDRGFGIAAKLYPYEDPEWWHIDGGDYQREHLDVAVNGPAEVGATELHLSSGHVFAHIPITEAVSAFKPTCVDRWVGVDLGERVLYAAAAVDGAGDVQEVSVEPGDEFRHHREQLDRKREQAMEARNIERVRNERERYTDQVTHTASRQIVDLAASHPPCGIRIEDLTGYRERADEPIHDWPYHLLAEQIVYKAAEAGVPVEAVDPHHTSTTCRMCGVTNPASRNGAEFACLNCGYQVHADVNAAINIAAGGAG